jgi:hypothetical protein
MAIVDFDTECWDDPWLQERSPLAKLLFIYLWTNSHRNISGLYVITKQTMISETGLNLKQINLALDEIKPKVWYDLNKSVCFVVKHVRRQFLRHSGKISSEVRIGIRNKALKLRYHPFFSLFIKEYPEIFESNEFNMLDASIRPSTDSHQTLTRLSPEVPGGGMLVVLDNPLVKEELVASSATIDKKTKKTSSHPKTVEEFIMEIKKSSAYSHLNIDKQIEKIKIWLLKPENKGKKLTSGRILNWLNREPEPLNSESLTPPTDPLDRRMWEIEQLRKKN